MKKNVVSILVATALLLGPLVASADTASTTVSSQVQAMLDQIKTLQLQIQTLNAAQAQVQVAGANVGATLSLIGNLRQGMSGSDVTTLQTILASDPSVYPEGLVTGFFGAKTALAVKKFQSKHGIDAVGFVGPKTLQKLNEEIGNLGLKEDLSDENATTSMGLMMRNVEHGKKFCIPPGHMIAEGWQKTHGDENRPLVAPCALPPGIANHGDHSDDQDEHHATSTPDTTAPVISSLTAHVMATSSQISWMTNEPATSGVVFSVGTPTTPAIVLQQRIPVIVPGLSMNHSVVLSGLATSTVYTYAVVSSDIFGNTATSSEGIFTTLAQ